MKEFKYRRIDGGIVIEKYLGESAEVLAVSSA